MTSFVQKLFICFFAFNIATSFNQDMEEWKNVCNVRTSYVYTKLSAGTVSILVSDNTTDMLDWKFLVQAEVCDDDGGAGGHGQCGGGVSGTGTMTRCSQQYSDIKLVTQNITSNGREETVVENFVYPSGCNCLYLEMF